MDSGHIHIDSSFEATKQKLVHLNQLIHKSEFLQAFALIRVIINGLDGQKELSFWQREATTQKIEFIYSRLAESLTELFEEEKFELSREEYLFGLLVRERFWQIFSIAKMNDKRRSLLSNIIGKNLFEQSDKILATSASELYKFLLLVSASDDDAIQVLVQLSKQNPASTYFVVLSIWGNEQWIEAKDINNKTQLEITFPLFTRLVPSIQSLSIIQKCLAKTAYLPTKNVQITKPLFDTLLWNYVNHRNWPSIAERKTVKLPTYNSKPKLILICECFWPGHVIHRCFVELVKPLKDQFEVIAVTAKKDYRSPNWDFCDQVIAFDLDIFSQHLLINQLAEIHADIAVYTSIGLRLWSTLMAQIKIAPIQVLLAGHPDSQLPLPRGIDKLLVGTKLFESNHPKLHIYNAPGSLYSRSYFSGYHPNEKRGHRAKSEVLRIAVCPNVFKLNYLLVDVLLEIEKRTTRPIEFHVFQNLDGLEFILGKHLIKEFISNTIVHPAYHKNQYLSILSSCDALLGTTPFGGENTVLDALYSKVPVLIKHGNQVREKLDYRVLNSLPDLPEIAIATTIENWIQNIVCFIEDENLRAQYQKFIRKLDIRPIFSNELDLYNHSLLDEITVIHQAFNQ